MRPRYVSRHGLQFAQDKRLIGVAPKAKKARTVGSWDISVAGARLIAITASNVLNVVPGRAALSADGTFLYWCGSNYQNDMYRARLRTPFALSSADFTQFETIPVASLTNVGGFSFSPDGRYFVAMREGASTSGFLFSYRLTTPWDLKTAVLISSRNYGNTGVTERFLGVIQNGTRALGDDGQVASTLSPNWRDLGAGSNGGLDLDRVFFETPDGRYRFSCGKSNDNGIRRERLTTRYGLDVDETVNVFFANYSNLLTSLTISGSFCFSLDGRFLYLALSDRSVAQIRLKG
ncbi:hypothetical protein J2Y63_003762 [Shinella sp. BE166]|uniref:hypothetical protein n=1 Tax=Shinella sp. BE166 TaxID=3373918 RepID=UPI003EB878C4